MVELQTPHLTAECNNLPMKDCSLVPHHHITSYNSCKHNRFLRCVTLRRQIFIKQHLSTNKALLVEGSFSLKTGSFLLHSAPTSNLGLVTAVGYPTQSGPD